MLLFQRSSWILSTLVFIESSPPFLENCAFAIELPFAREASAWLNSDSEK